MHFAVTDAFRIINRVFNHANNRAIAIMETITPLDETGYRLPTEAQWEFGCRAGTTTKYWIGDTDKELVLAGWFDGNSGGRPHAAGELKANPLGLYDIHGNVWEWVEDGWDRLYYGQFAEKPAINPSSQSSADSQRMVRGGGWTFTASGTAVANVERREKTAQQQRKKLDFVNQLDSLAATQLCAHDNLESAIANYELAYQMQMAVPDLMDFSQETAQIRSLSGLDAGYEPTKIYAAECLLTRRLVERGVRFIELTGPQVGGDRWDQHNNLKEGHQNNALAVDQPIAALLTDL